MMSNGRRKRVRVEAHRQHSIRSQIDMQSNVHILAAGLGAVITAAAFFVRVGSPAANLVIVMLRFVGVSLLAVPLLRALSPWLRAAPIWPWPVIAMLAAGLLAFSHWTYVEGTPRRRLLLTLRWIAVGLVLFSLLRPSLVYSKKIRQSSLLIVTADVSKSMGLRDMWDDQSRAQVQSRLLQESEPHFAALAEDVRIERFEFARTLRATNSLSAPTGEQTALGEALAEISRRAAGERLAGIILLTDGTNTTGVSPLTAARQLQGLKVPIYAFGFGKEIVNDTLHDVAAMSIVTSPTVFVKNKTPVRGEFAAPGFTNRPIGVRLLLDGQEQAAGELRIESGQQRGMIDLSAMPQKAGDVKLTMVAEPQDGELLPANNSVSTYVTVLSGGISVLYIEGKYRAWEPKYIRWALDKSPDIELNSMFLLDTANQRPELPPDLFESRNFDVIILGDVHANQFTATDNETMSRLVRNGTGLMMIGGYDSFGPGDWRDTPIADVLPVEVRPSDGQRKDRLKLMPTEAGLRHFILRLAASATENRDAWQALPPLDGASAWSRLKPGARLLAATPDGVPLLAAQDVGEGRTIAFAGDTTWRWRKDAQSIRHHQRFWRQLILWLAHKDDSSGKNVRVRLERRRLAIGQKLPVQVRVETADGEEVDDVELSAQVDVPQLGPAPLKLFKQDDAYRGTFWQTDVVGDYTVRVTATSAGELLGTTSVKFLVYEDDAELRQFAADHETLRSIAESTGGEFHTSEELPEFVRSLKDRDLNQEITQPVYENLWDRWQLLSLFVVVVCAEWIVRKRHGVP